MLQYYIQCVFLYKQYKVVYNCDLGGNETVSPHFYKYKCVKSVQMCTNLKTFVFRFL